MPLKAVGSNDTSHPFCLNSGLWYDALAANMSCITKGFFYFQPMAPPDKMFRDKRIEFFLVFVGSINNIEQVFLCGEDSAFFECECSL